LKRIAIVAPAGSGKSMFMKHTFMELCNNPFGRIPILIELRELNNAKENGLFSYIHRQWTSLIPSFNEERIKYAFKSGKYILLLDGLDEVDHTARDDLCRQILDMTYKYSDCIFLITSRPDESRFSGWNEFYVGSILPFSGRQVELFIEKIDFDAKLKARFILENQKKSFKESQRISIEPSFMYNDVDDV
jgi:predicted NACHT family NTPase